MSSQLLLKGKAAAEVLFVIPYLSLQQRSEHRLEDSYLRGLSKLEGICCMHTKYCSASAGTQREPLENSNRIGAHKISTELDKPVSASNCQSDLIQGTQARTSTSTIYPTVENTTMSCNSESSAVSRQTPLPKCASTLLVRHTSLTEHKYETP